MAFRFSSVLIESSKLNMMSFAWMALISFVWVVKQPVEIGLYSAGNWGVYKVHGQFISENMGERIRILVPNHI